MPYTSTGCYCLPTLPPPAQAQSAQSYLTLPNISYARDEPCTCRAFPVARGIRPYHINRPSNMASRLPWRSSSSRQSQGANTLAGSALLWFDLIRRCCCLAPRHVVSVFWSRPAHPAAYLLTGVFTTQGNEHACGSQQNESAHNPACTHDIKSHCMADWTTVLRL